MKPNIQTVETLFLSVLFVLVFCGVSLGEATIPEGPDYPKHYPAAFSGTGQIIRMDSQIIVIDDTSYKIFPYTSFHTFNMRKAPRRWFKEGQYVGFVEGNRGEIIELYQLKAK
jgi:hypothetical protein